MPALLLMKNPYTMIALAMMVALTLIPPIDLSVSNPANSLWPWMVLIFAFFGLYIIFIKTNIILKIISCGALVNCFFSVAPYMSFTSYCLMVLSFYYYIAASRIENWDIIFNGVKVIFILNVLLILMQFTGHDSLLNFAVGDISKQDMNTVRVGVIGQHMQMGSFSVILSTFLTILSPWFFLFPFVVGLLCHSLWTIISAGAGLLVFFAPKDIKLTGALTILFLVLATFFSFKEGKVAQAFASSGRIPVFKEIFHFSNQRPFFGWGIGTFKNVFPAICVERKTEASLYKTAHSCWLEILFEAGYPAFIFSILVAIYVGLVLYWIGGYTLLAGLVMIVVNMMGHFPTREIQCVPLIILFFAYCEQQAVRHGLNSK